MNETRFLKTVTFGGYDKNDVDKRIESLYSRIAVLESELTTAKSALEKYRNGSEQEKVYSETLAEERDKLAESLAKNKSLSDKVEALTAENQERENEINNLKYSVAELEQNLADADIKLSAMSEKDDSAVFGSVFAAAKKSAEEIIEKAKKKAEELDTNSKKLAENIVAEANNKASDIVYEAEVYAAEMTAEVDSQQIEAVDNNIKAVLLEDVNELKEKISLFREAFEELKNYGGNILDRSESMLAETHNTIIRNGIPVFRNIESVQPELPEKPVHEKTDYSYSSTPESENNFSNYEYENYDDVPDFDELEEVDILGDDDDDDFDLSGLVRSTPASRGGVNLDALNRQTEEFMGRKKPNLDEIMAQASAIDSTPKKAESGSMNLAELAKQAEALEETPPKKADSGSIDLASLMAQANALDE
ncbi:MAG: hypothetical protein NC177_11715 [Ruminococcus flavefaciens]|nr:hypothetical protein [Ruminococcus flavefaciens]